MDTKITRIGSREFLNIDGRTMIPVNSISAIRVNDRQDYVEIEQDDGELHVYSGRDGDGLRKFFRENEVAK